MMGGKLKRIFTILLSSILGLGLLVFLAAIYAFPDTVLSVFVFKASYWTSINKKGFLELYSPKKRDVENGNIPPGVDEFLCNRVETTKSDSEVEAITNFYTIQAGGREGRCIYATSDAAKEKMLEVLIKDFDKGHDTENKLVLIEEIRQSRSLGKGHFTISGIGRESGFDLNPNWKEEGLSLAKSKYQEWWYSGLSWEEKKNINPLKESFVGIFECCG